MVRINLKEEGITLVTLIVTIIILLILAGVTVNIAISNNGIIEKSKYAVKEYKNKKEIEEGELEKYENFLGEFQPEETEKYIGTEWKFDYTGSEQTFVVPCSGKFKIEAWGAQGGNFSGPDCNGYSCDNIGGYGGYSTGVINLEKNNKIFINVGGQGESVYSSTSNFHQSPGTGGYNGGGDGGYGYNSGFPGGTGGGGATSIATKSGILASLLEYKDSILVISGAGGGGSWNTDGGSGGGISGKEVSLSFNSNYVAAGNQTTGFAFGKGQTGSGGCDAAGSCEGASGAGAGLYGGYAYQIMNAYKSIGGAGGSGYIGNYLLTDKHMAGYNIETSEDESTKTISVADASEEPKADYAKIGNGYAKITYLGN